VEREKGRRAFAGPHFLSVGKDALKIVKSLVAEFVES